MTRDQLAAPTNKMAEADVYDSVVAVVSIHGLAARGGDP